jgi:hypothetical protein
MADPGTPEAAAAQRRDPGALRRRQLPIVLRLSPQAIMEDLRAVEGFNAKFALLLTKVVGTMWTFYVFNGIALVSLPSAIRSGSLVVLINWVSSNWLQLILLPSLMVGQNLQAATADARAIKNFEDTEVILDRLDTHTTGGLRDVLDAIESLKR